jgi:hypothetical protein
VENAAKYLIDHYQKTYELTYALWNGRNKTFLILLAAVGVAALVTFPALGGRSVVFLYAGNSLGLKPEDVTALQNGFPFSLLQAIFLFVIFYLIVNLYHRARYVLRNYAYLSALEREIRQQLALPDSTVAFTRESTFYWGNRDFFSGAVKYVYIILLSCLIVSFLVATIVEDWIGHHRALSVVDVLFAVPTLAFLVAYARASLSMDTKETIAPNPQATAKGAD